MPNYPDLKFTCSVKYELIAVDHIPPQAEKTRIVKEGTADFSKNERCEKDLVFTELLRPF